MSAEFSVAGCHVTADHPPAGSFSEKLAACLKDDLDVGCVDDLKYIYDDPDLLGMVEKKAARVQFKKFLDAQALTNPIDDPNIPLVDAVIVAADPDAPPPVKAAKTTKWTGCAHFPATHGGDDPEDVFKD